MSSQLSAPHSPPRVFLLRVYPCPPFRLGNYQIHRSQQPTRPARVPELIPTSLQQQPRSEQQDQGSLSIQPSVRTWWASGQSPRPRPNMSSSRATGTVDSHSTDHQRRPPLPVLDTLDRSDPRHRSTGTSSPWHRQPTVANRRVRRHLLVPHTHTRPTRQHPPQTTTQPPTTTTHGRVTI